jgi:transcriptional regulator with XRE-family HTH domain
MEEELDVRVKGLLAARKGDWLVVAEKSGISYSWLSKFFNGHIDNPGYATLKKLLAYLEDGVESAPEPTASEPARAG